MGFFSSLFGEAHKSGLSNSSSNMHDPLDREGCLRLCSIYDNLGGYKNPSPARFHRLVGPGMVLYRIFKAADGRELKRGVLFYSYGDEAINKAQVFEWMDLGDGGCPCFSTHGELEFVEGDLYRTKQPFTTYVDGKKMNTIGELNWNTYTNEFAYREIYTPAE